MSYGALNLGDRYLSLSSEVVQPADFKDTQYIASSPLLTEGFGIPESAIPQLNRIIGQLLMTIQEASFIRRSVLEVVPLARYEGEEPVYPRRPLICGSTLSANTIAITIRQNIEKTVRDVLALTGGSAAENTADSAGAVQTPKEKPPARYKALLFSNDDHRNELACTDLLTNEARNLIDQLGAGCAKAVNELLRVFAEGILNKADLSFGSLTRDVTMLAEQSEESTAEANFPKNAPYSTLNPTNLIAMARGDLGYFSVGLATRLPDEIKEGIFARLPKPTKSAPPVTATT